VTSKQFMRTDVETKMGMIDRKIYKNEVIGIELVERVLKIAQKELLTKLQQNVQKRT
jgi:hypothetical protein